MGIQEVIAKALRISGLVGLMLWGSSAIAQDPLGDCGNGFMLDDEGFTEDQILPGNARELDELPPNALGGVNGDEFLCIWTNVIAPAVSGMNITILTDNRRQGGGNPND